MIITESTISQHILEGRMDRVEFIASHIGWGKELFHTYDRRNPNTIVLILTSTGVVIVKDRITDKIITVYIASAGKIDMLYQQVKHKPAPARMVQKAHDLRQNYPDMFFSY